MAARSDAVDAVAAVEPTIFNLMDDRDRAGLDEAVARIGELAADGNMAAAVRALLGLPVNDQEIAVADEAGYFETAGRYVRTLLNQLRQTMESGGPRPDDPALLGAISAPVLVLHGSDTKPSLPPARGTWPTTPGTHGYTRFPRRARLAADPSRGAR